MPTCSSLWEKSWLRHWYLSITIFVNSITRRLRRIHLLQCTRASVMRIVADTADAIHMQMIYCSLSHTTQGDNGTQPGRDSSLTGNPCVIFRRIYAEDDESDDFQAFCQTSYYRQWWWHGIPIVLYFVQCDLRFASAMSDDIYSTYFCNCFSFVFTPA